MSVQLVTARRVFAGGVAATRIDGNKRFRVTGKRFLSTIRTHFMTACLSKSFHATQNRS